MTMHMYGVYCIYITLGVSSRTYTYHDCENTIISYIESFSDAIYCNNHLV